MYEGEWKNSEANGKGVYYSTDGTLYKGNWENWVMNGRGKEKMTNGVKYIGQYIYGVKTGEGVYIWPKIGRYEGGLVNNELHGLGRLQ